MPNVHDLEQLNAHSRWISTPLRGTGLAAPPSPMLRRPFTLEQKPAAAELVITALGVYEPWINGRRVGDFELQPGWTDYHHRVAVQRYDVTDRLAAGGNTLGVFLGDGWYSGKVAHLDRGMKWGGYPLLRAVLMVQDSDGRWGVAIATDERWRWHRGPILSSDTLDGEHYDARREIAGWCDATQSADDDWFPVQLDQPDPEPELVVSDAPPVRVVRELKPIAEPVRGRQPGWPRPRWLFDFGQNFTGKVRLRITGAAGMTVRLQYAEVLQPDGKDLDRSNLRSCVATDTYTLKGDPDGEAWEPRFTFHGFRYASLDHHNPRVIDKSKPEFEPFTVETLTGLVMHNDMTRIGTFECGHKLLNRLHENIVWGLKSNFLEVPTDCPQRDERLGWTGDAQVFAPTASFIYDTSGFYDKWLTDLADAQLPDGGIPFYAPAPDCDCDSGGGWADAVVLVPWAVYNAFGDENILASHYPMMKRWVGYHTRTHPDGYCGDPKIDKHAGFGDWLALDNNSNQAQNNATPKPLVGIAYLVHSLTRFARIARLLGHDRDADDAQRFRETAHAKFRELFVNGGQVTVKSQTAHLMALAFDLVDDDERPAVFEELLGLLAERDHHLCTGFLGTPLWCDVLTREGRADLAYDLLLTETFPGWLYPVTLGATTMWERWNSWHPEKGFVEVGMNSLNHYAYGAVGDWMHRVAAGIDLHMAADVGPKLHLRPHPEPRLGHCRAALDSPLGRIASSWVCKDGKAELKLTVPDGVPATLTLPGQEARAIESGEHEMELAL